LYTVLWMTNVPIFFIEAGWWYQSGNQQWQKWRPLMMDNPMRHRTWRFGSHPGGPSFRPDTAAQVVSDNKSSTAKDMEPCQYCYFTPSASAFLTSSLGNGTTTTQIRKVNNTQQMIRVWQCTIHPSTAAMLVLWSPECSPNQDQYRSEHSATPKGYFWGSKKVLRRE